MTIAYEIVSVFHGAVFWVIGCVIPPCSYSLRTVGILTSSEVIYAPIIWMRLKLIRNLVLIVCVGRGAVCSPSLCFWTRSFKVGSGEFWRETSFQLTHTPLVPLLIVYGSITFHFQIKDFSVFDSKTKAVWDLWSKQGFCFFIDFWSQIPLIWNALVLWFGGNHLTSINLLSAKWDKNSTRLAG